MPADEEQLYTKAEMDALIEAKLEEKQREQLLEEVRTEFEKFRTEARAESLKHERSIRTVGQAVKDVEKLLKNHIDIPFHAGGAEEIEALKKDIEKGMTLDAHLALSTLSEEELETLPVVLRDAVAQKRAREQSKEAFQQRRDRLSLVAMAVGMASGLAATLGINAWLHKLFGWLGW